MYISGRFPKICECHFKISKNIFTLTPKRTSPILIFFSLGFANVFM